MFVATRPDESLAGHKERAWRELGVIDEALLRGEIDDDGWHERVLAIVEPAYLAARDAAGPVGPQRRRRPAGSTPAGCCWTRCPTAADVLDVGCANGLLMESLGGVGRRGRPHPSRRTASRSPPGWPTWPAQRLPHWADRIWTGNAMTWVPPRRFDVVRTGLDYVPPRRRADFVERLLAEVVAPGGRLVVGVFNEEKDRDTVADALRSWGYAVAGSTSRAHRDPRLRYKAVWVDA